MWFENFFEFNIKNFEQYMSSCLHEQELINTIITFTISVDSYLVACQINVLVFLSSFIDFFLWIVVLFAVFLSRCWQSLLKTIALSTWMLRNGEWSNLSTRERLNVWLKIDGISWPYRGFVSIKCDFLSAELHWIAQKFFWNMSSYC